MQAITHAGTQAGAQAHTLTKKSSLERAHVKTLFYSILYDGVMQASTLKDNVALSVLLAQQVPEIDGFPLVL